MAKCVEPSLIYKTECKHHVCITWFSKHTKRTKTTFKVVKFWDQLDQNQLLRSAFVPWLFNLLSGARWGLLQHLLPPFSPLLCCPVLSQALKHCIRAPPTGRWNFTSTGASAVPGDPQTATFHYDFRRTALKTLIQNKCVYATIIYEGPFIPAAVLIGTCRAITCIPNDIN